MVKMNCEISGELAKGAIVTPDMVNSRQERLMQAPSLQGNS